MRTRILVALVAAVATTACPYPTAPRVRGVSGGVGGSGDQLVYVTQPASAVANITIAPAVQVAAVDSLGVVDSTFTGAVTLTLVTSTVGASLSGTTTVSAVLGVAVFSDLSVNPAGTGYTLLASGSGLASVGSTSFDITSAAVSAR